MFSTDVEAWVLKSQSETDIFASATDEEDDEKEEGEAGSDTEVNEVQEVVPTSLIFKLLYIRTRRILKMKKLVILKPLISAAPQRVKMMQRLWMIQQALLQVLLN